MLVYLLPITISLIAAYFFEFREWCNDPLKMSIYISLYLYVTFFIGFRYMVGGDSYFYSLYFDSLPSVGLFAWPFEDNYQLLFSFFTRIAKYIYQDFTSFQILHAILLNTGIFYFLSKSTKNYMTALFFSFVMFYINFSVEILRESLAVLVFLYGYKYCAGNRLFIFLCFALLAILFHLSAIVLIVFPFLSWLRFNKKFVLISIGLLISLPLMELIFSSFESLDIIWNKIQDYEDVSFGWKSTFMFFMAKTILPASFFYWSKFKERNSIKYEWLMCVYVLLGICAIYNLIVFTRFSNYIIPFFCIALSEALVNIYRNNRYIFSRTVVRTYTLTFVLIGSVISFYWPSAYYEKWIPYYSIFSEEAQLNKFIDRDY